MWSESYCSRGRRECAALVLESKLQIPQNTPPLTSSCCLGKTPLICRGSTTRVFQGDLSVYSVRECRKDSGVGHVLRLCDQHQAQHCSRRGREKNLCAIKSPWLTLHVSSLESLALYLSISGRFSLCAQKNRCWNARGVHF